ncbi:hypothetical protein MKW98_025264 [Papaver atlanticum]|uniref:Uncharacterized protein n=1 Tax=Papaver atlanticum TaxID=357466 RepID=A0AAD4X6E3_9MAGN|nr:hypothetical protein MKW98_025264 [Papaver atlanticum]
MKILHHTEYENTASEVTQLLSDAVGTSCGQFLEKVFGQIMLTFFELHHQKWTYQKKILIKNGKGILCLYMNFDCLTWSNTFSKNSNGKSEGCTAFTLPGLNRVFHGNDVFDYY